MVCKLRWGICSKLAAFSASFSARAFMAVRPGKAGVGDVGRIESGGRIGGLRREEFTGFESWISFSAGSGAICASWIFCSIWSSRRWFWRYFAKSGWVGVSTGDFGRGRKFGRVRGSVSVVGRPVNGSTPVIW